MPVVTRAITIAAPPPQVWEVLADVPGQPRWMRDLRRVRIDTPGPIGVGTRAVGTVRILGLRQDDPIEIDAYDPPRHFGIRHLGRFKGRGDLWLSERDGGQATRVIWREELRLRGEGPGLPAWAADASARLDPLLGPVFALVFRADLRRLRDLVLAVKPEGALERQ